ncbi:MAG: lamin tail domain-containing protein, partial [Gemmatimonadaceae bacterium]|nr:lamin tail domain-containing protein [Gemmatimonadaceae bacterium]
MDPKSPAPVMVSVAPAAPKMVISQLYGAGGNSGATLNADYVELFNAGTATASLSGWSVQYASATGTGN